MQNTLMKPAAKASLVESEEILGQELFLYDETDGSVHTLSSGAAMIWLLCDGSRDLAGITAEICLVSATPKTQILLQVQAAVAQFQVLGLLEG